MLRQPQQVHGHWRLLYHVVEKNRHCREILENPADSIQT